MNYSKAGADKVVNPVLFGPISFIGASVSYFMDEESTYQVDQPYTTRQQDPKINLEYTRPVVWLRHIGFAGRDVLYLERNGQLIHGRMQ